jgi:apolipoprotein D and lipocalin family protein
VRSPWEDSAMRAYASLLMCFFGVALMFGAKPPLEVVPSVDWHRYQGKWYEIARFPNRFEKDCVSDVIAEYSLKPGSTVEVVNTCKKANGEMKRSVGVSKPLDKDPTTPKLKVSFFWPLYGDYWILELDSEVRWALVASRSANICGYSAGLLPWTNRFTRAWLPAPKQKASTPANWSSQNKAFNESYARGWKFIDAEFMQ